MYLLEWYCGFFIGYGERSLALVIALSGIACFVALAIAVKSKTTFFALSLLDGVILNLVFMAYEKSLQAALVCDLTLGGAVCVGTIALQVGLQIRARAEKRKRERAKIVRKLEYTLPDRENRYLRDRLHTALYYGRAEKEERAESVLHLEYVKKLLENVHNAPLAPAERLEAESMARLFHAYLDKNKWTSEDVRAVNDLFTRLLKLSAKYAV